jgi:hypothetical protein
MTETQAPKVVPPSKPHLKAGKDSTEYKGKITIQVVLAGVAALNWILSLFGKDPVVMSSETAGAFVLILEIAWQGWRQWCKREEMRSHTELEKERVRAEAEIAKEHVKAQGEIEREKIKKNGS